MSLLTYNDVRPWAKAIKQAVLVRKMPPWFADGVHGDFSNDRRLSKEEIDTIAAWVDGGAKEGDAKDAPAPLAFAEGWAMGKPDAVIEMPAAYDVPASGTVEYTYFVVPTGFTEDKWVQSLEVRAGSRQVCITLYCCRARHGANLPWGEGETPIKEVLLLLKKNKWPIPANIEYEYGKSGMDTVAEVKKCFQYCKNALA